MRLNHIQNSTAGVQLYELLRPKFPSVLKLFMQIPNVNQQDLQRFDEKILNSSQSFKINYKVDKTTKDLFKKITHPVSSYHYVSVILCLFLSISKIFFLSAHR